MITSMIKRMSPLLLCFALAGCATEPEEEPVCGNGIVELGESCDGPNVRSETCTSSGYLNGNLRCDNYCQLDYSSCRSRGSRDCGNGYIEADEECDSNDVNGLVCPDNITSLSCARDCTLTYDFCPPVEDGPACTENASIECHSGDVYFYNSCGQRGAIAERCGSNETCSNGRCVDNGPTCTSNASTACSGGNVHYYDSCGQRGAIAERCDSSETCSNGRCVDNGPTCTVNTSIACFGGDAYHYNSCGERGAIAERCSSNETCSRGECISNGPTCSASDYWMPTTSQAISPSVDGVQLGIQIAQGVNNNSPSNSLYVRACKNGSNFDNDLHLLFVEDEKYSNVAVLFDGKLPKTSPSSSCTEWVLLGYTSNWQTNEVMGGFVRIVSPYSRASSCDATCSNSCGHCWSFDYNDITRTCKQ